MSLPPKTVVSVPLNKVVIDYGRAEIALDNWQKLQPLSEDDRTRLRRRFTVDFNYNSNHLEGNTLTYGQTEILHLFGKVTCEAELKDQLKKQVGKFSLVTFVVW